MPTEHHLSNYPTGSLIHVTGSGGIQSYATGSSVIHSAILINRGQNNLSVLESIPSHGVQEISLENFLQREVQLDHGVSVSPLRNYNISIKDVDNYIQTVEGQKYASVAKATVAGFYTNLPMTQKIASHITKNNNTKFCSELSADFLEKLKIITLERDASLIIPKELASMQPPYVFNSNHISFDTPVILHEDNSSTSNKLSVPLSYSLTSYLTLGLSSVDNAIFNTAQTFTTGEHTVRFKSSADSQYLSASLENHHPITGNSTNLHAEHTPNHNTISISKKEPMNSINPDFSILTQINVEHTIPNHSTSVNTNMGLNYNRHWGILTSSTTILAGTTLDTLDPSFVYNASTELRLPLTSDTKMSWSTSIKHTPDYDNITYESDIIHRVSKNFNIVTGIQHIQEDKTGYANAPDSTTITLGIDYQID